MGDIADLEIGLRRASEDAYAVDLRYNQPSSAADVRLAQGGPWLARFDLNRLRAQTVDDGAYGQLLSQCLFADANVRTAFAQARSSARTLDAALRVRLFVDPGAPELHALRWELLCDPQDGSRLFTGENVLFSRYLSSDDWRPVRLRPQSGLRALVIIASPTNLAEYGNYQLAPLKVAEELARAQAYLSGIGLTVLASQAPAGQPVAGAPTLQTIVDKLRDDYDIVYIVAHGALIAGAPNLWLEDDAGRTDQVDGAKLITRIKELQQAPRLVVLASCQSGALSADGAHAALGPQLAQAGVTAVLAMQGNISLATVGAFMPAFFKELQRDGQIDRAVAVARGAVREQPDAWMPVLFMRLKSGRIWYVPGFGSDPNAFKKWPALIDSIRDGRCTPIIGAGITDSLLGTRGELANYLADKFRFPLGMYSREDLPEVAQYLAVDQSLSLLRNNVEQFFRQQIALRAGAGALPAGASSPDPRTAARNTGGVAPAAAAPDGLQQLISKAWADVRARDPVEPHSVLAQLPCPIYLTTNPDDLMAEALRAAGRKPEVELCRWYEDMATKDATGAQDTTYGPPGDSIFAREPGYRPSVERPLVFHLFGHLKERASLVLTEDEYFDYLIGLTQNKVLVPGIVRRVLADSALLFLGFQMDDWNFRVLFRSIIEQQGGKRRELYAHVAAQIDPEDGRILDPERARRYLESYFQGSDISIYWGTPDNFAKDLQQRMQASSA